MSYLSSVGGKTSFSRRFGRDPDLPAVSVGASVGAALTLKTINL